MIYLVRHGQTEWNQSGRLQGHRDSPLTALGVAQAEAVARLLRTLLPTRVRIETSPLGRAIRTASILCANLGLDPHTVVVQPLLSEHDVGHWQGLTHSEIDAAYPGERAARASDKWGFRIPGGESYALLSRRAQTWLETQRHQIVTVAVTHEMLSRTIQGSYLRMTPEQTLQRSHRQDRIYVLRHGTIDELRVSP